MAFWELSSDRQVGMVTGQIPWSSIKRYHQDNPFLSFELFLQIIRAMDSEYLSGDSGKTLTRDMIKR